MKMGCARTPKTHDENRLFMQFCILHHVIIAAAFVPLNGCSKNTYTRQVNQFGNVFGLQVGIGTQGAFPVGKGVERVSVGLHKVLPL